MSVEFDTEAVKDQLYSLHDMLDDLEEALLPLKIKEQDSTIATYCERESLDPIAKAKMFVTMGYAIDSLMFCYLKATGVKTEQHTIMNELERIKVYVGKIKEATAHQKRSTSLNKAAANRVIGNDLSANAAHDRDRALKTAQTNQRLQERLAEMASSNIGMHTRFENSAISKAPTERLNPGRSEALDEGDDTLQISGGDLSKAAPGTDIPEVGDDGGSSEPEEGSLAARSTATRVAQRKEQSNTPVTTAMFEETKAERKTRERKERRSAKKDRQKQTKAKRTARASQEAT